MSEDLINSINCLNFVDDMETSLKSLVSILSRDWVKGLTSLKRSQILVNTYGSKKNGERITTIIDCLANTVPSKFKNRYLKYFSSILPLNALLQELARGIIKTEFWQLDKEVCLTSLLARFEAVYAHIDLNATSLITEGLKDNTIHLGKPVLLRADDGSFIEADKKIQQLAASLDRNLRFIEFYLNRHPLANLNTSPEVYMAGTLQMTGELWNSIFYLIDKVSLFDWYATREGATPEQLYYQPKNQTEHIIKIVGGLRESQWLLQQLMDTEKQYRSIKEYIKTDDPFAPRNEMELRAYVELSEMCHDNKILDVKFKNDLRVKEYIRAWYIISEIAQEHFTAKKQLMVESDHHFDISNLLVMSADALIEVLAGKGNLCQSSAKKSMELLTYWNMDRDVFSSPLFPTIHGNYIILSSIFLAGNPVRSVFRLLSYDKIDISFKGLSSESELESIFRRMGFSCSAGYKYSDEHGDGDIDCIAHKENTFIVCESKNIIPNESTYDRYRSTELFTKKASNQANRGVRFVREHLSEVAEKLSIKNLNTSKVRIYPMIITNLFDFTGLIINGVPVCDFSALGKFATAKYVYRTIRSKEGITKVPVKELYSGDMPTADELLNQIHNPFQIEYQAKKLELSSITQPMTKDLTLRVFDVRESTITDEEFETV